MIKDLLRDVIEENEGKLIHLLSSRNPRSFLSQCVSDRFITNFVFLITFI